MDPPFPSLLVFCLVPLKPPRHSDSPPSEIGFPSTADRTSKRKHFLPSLSSSSSPPPLTKHAPHKNTNPHFLLLSYIILCMYYLGGSHECILDFIEKKNVILTKIYLRPQLLPGRLRGSLPRSDRLPLLPALVVHHGGGQRARVHGDDDQRLLVELLQIASPSSPVQALH